MSQHRRCTKCHVTKDIGQFSLKANGNYLKSCDVCREKNNRKNRERYHNKGGKERWRVARREWQRNNSNKVRQYSQTYSRSHRAQENARHNKYVKLNPGTARLATMCSRVRTSDKLKDRYDADRHIDRVFLETLMEDQEMKCVYCGVEMLLHCESRHDHLMSIERKDNSIGHIKSNCALACYACNMNRNNRYTFDEFKQVVWYYKTLDFIYS